MYCTKCGTKLPGEALFCWKCGEKVPILDQQSATSGGGVANADPPAVQNPTGGSALSVRPTEPQSALEVGNVNDFLAAVRNVTPGTAITLKAGDYYLPAALELEK